MPLYEYVCERCGHSFERLVFHEDDQVECPECSGRVRKILSRFNVEIPDEACAKLPKGEKREYCNECRQGGGACPLAA